jgi:hypothetical protein
MMLQRPEHAVEGEEEGRRMDDNESNGECALAKPRVDE